MENESCEHEWVYIETVEKEEKYKCRKCSLEVKVIIGFDDILNHGGKVVEGGDVK